MVIIIGFLRFSWQFPGLLPGHVCVGVSGGRGKRLPPARPRRTRQTGHQAGPRQPGTGIPGPPPPGSDRAQRSWLRAERAILVISCAVIVNPVCHGARRGYDRSCLCREARACVAWRALADRQGYGTSGTNPVEGPTWPLPTARCRTWQRRAPGDLGFHHSTHMVAVKDAQPDREPGNPSGCPVARRVRCRRRLGRPEAGLRLPPKLRRGRLLLAALAGGFMRCSVHGRSTGCRSLRWRDRSIERGGGAGIAQHPGLGGRRRGTN